MSTIGERVRAMRQQRGLSQRELARRTAGEDAPAVGYTTISRLESGFTERVRPDTLARIARALDVEVEELTDPDAVDEGDRLAIVSAAMILERHPSSDTDADIARARDWLRDVIDRHGWS